MVIMEIRFAADPYGILVNEGKMHDIDMDDPDRWYASFDSTCSLRIKYLASGVNISSIVGSIELVTHVSRAVLLPTLNCRSVNLCCQSTDIT